ncbi:MAG: nucleoside deaminase [Planctomycetota bacterium]|nr:nucleoside deaminase [Planctomycetota bacterium]
MSRAIALAEASVADGGGPFGALVVQAGAVIGEACNRVVPDADPTAHAEVGALRAAAKALGTHLLEGCEVYSSCEPCPMCLAALYWARVERVWFAATRADAAAAGFDDDLIYREVALPLDQRQLQIACSGREAGQAPFRAWRAAADKVPY